MAKAKKLKENLDALGEPKDFEAGAKTVLLQDVGGINKGTQVEVVESQKGGRIFLVKWADRQVRVLADQLS
jgi:hypothetical protein